MFGVTCLTCVSRTILNIIHVHVLHCQHCHIVFPIIVCTFVICFLQKQNIEIKQTKQHFEDELTKLKSGVVLDMNLERSRAKEAVSTR